MRAREYICAACGNPFEPTRSDARTCSDACRQAAHRARQANQQRQAWEDELRDWTQTALASLGFDPNKLPGLPRYLSCGHCGELCPADGFAGYCGSFCEAQAKRASDDGEQRICAECGSTFTERWIFRLHGAPLCMACCKADTGYVAGEPNREILSGLMRGDVMFSRVPGSVGSGER